MRGAGIRAKHVHYLPSFRWIPLLATDVTMRCWGRTSGLATAEVEGRSERKLGRRRADASMIKIKALRGNFSKTNKQTIKTERT